MDYRPILREQRSELEAIERMERLVPREASARAAKIIARPNVLAVLGVRRCGKSIFSYLLSKRYRSGYVNFHDERLSGTVAGDLDDILRSLYELHGDLDLVILDEIQEVNGWEPFANRLRRTMRVIVTGSSSGLLSGEMSTYLTGRHLDIVLHPLSFREFIGMKGIAYDPSPTTREKATILSLLEEYMALGGFPEVAKFGKPVLRAIYDDVLNNDVIFRHGIKNRATLKALARYLVSNTGSEVSFSRLGASLGIKHVSTVSNWVSFLEEAFLIMRLERFDFKLRKQFLASKKVYCVDSGILQVAGFSLSENRGRLIENLVAVELERRREPDGIELFYWKDRDQHEVDFVLKRGPKVIQLVQVTYAGSRAAVHPRETRALLGASDALRCDELLVISWDYEGSERLEGKTVRYVPLWKWLLEAPAGQKRDSGRNPNKKLLIGGT